MIFCIEYLFAHAQTAADGEKQLFFLLRDRGLVDGRAAAYVCRGMVCDRPVTTVEDLRALL